MDERRSRDMLAFIEALYPICRSITGDGLRQTLARIAREVPARLHEVPSGTRVFDWTVPREWNIRGAWLDGPGGERIVDFATHNLHVVNYSVPVDAVLSLDELAPHLHSLPEQPELVPYRTSYYDANWGFCLADRRRVKLVPGNYHAVVDAELRDGSLSLAELLVPGRSTAEVLVYSHACHPSLANDNLAGLAVTIWWAKALLRAGGQRYSYRFVWGPGTIGSISWLAMNSDHLARIRHGLVVGLVGRPGRFRYKRSRRGDAEIDRVAGAVLHETASGVEIRDFDPYGYDERQFCSPGIDLPVGRLTRAPNGEYPEYHTSADNLSLLDDAALDEAVEACIAITAALEDSPSYVNLAPRGEPQLGRRGLYRKTGGDSPRQREHALLWILNYSDGRHSLRDIAIRSGLPIEVIRNAARDLVAAGLLEEAPVD